MALQATYMQSRVHQPLRRALVLMVLPQLFLVSLHSGCTFVAAKPMLTQRDSILQDYDCSAPELLPALSNSSRIQDAIHVVYSSDEAGFPGLLDSMLSVVRHLREPSPCVLHLIVPAASLRRASGLVGCFERELPGTQVRVVLHTLRPLPFSIAGSQWGAPAFADAFIHEYLPGAVRALYLDVDVRVRADVAMLFRRPRRRPVAAVKEVGYWATPRMHPGLLRNDVRLCAGNHSDGWGGRSLRSLFPTLDTPIFNSGVMLLDLRAFRRGDGALSRRMAELVSRCPSDLGDQEYLNLAVACQFDELDWRWNLQGLCLGRRHSGECLERARILHFTGMGKPWHARNGCGVHADLLENRSFCSFVD